VTADNPVRLMDAFVEKLELEKLGFTHTVHKSEGRPPYAPAPMRKATIPFSLQMLQHTRVDYTVCPKSKDGKMEIAASYLNHIGNLVNLKDLQSRRRTKNKSSPVKSN
jgi:hypothetical protein